MFYENYERKMLQVAKIKNFIVKFRILFISVFAVITLLTTGFLSTKGMITEEVTVPDTLVYGQKITCNAKALFSDIVYYEYRAKNSNAWSQEVPTEIGEYYVRAVTKKSFGRTGYSDEVLFEILPKDLFITIDSNSIQYGANPKYIVDGLEYNDSISEINFELLDVTAMKTTASLNQNNLIITNKAGENVTSSYNIICESKEVEVSPTDITIRPSKFTKIYDGKPLVHDNSYEIVSGGLYYGDVLTITSSLADIENAPTEAGEYVNNVLESSFSNGSIDLNHQYNVKYQTNISEITRRQIKIKTCDYKQVFNGTYISKNDYEITEGSLVNGHSLVLDENTTIINVGTKENELVFRVVDENGNDVTRNYDISYDYGTLEITPLDVEIILDDMISTYDGSAYNTTATFTLNKDLYNSAVLVIDTYATKNGHAVDAIDAGTYELHVSLDNIYLINGSLDEFVLSPTEINNYNFTYKTSKLTIQKREVTIAPMSISDYYSGENWFDTTTESAVVNDSITAIESNWLIGEEPIKLDLIYKDKNGNTLNPKTSVFNAGEYEISIKSHNKDLDKNYIINYGTGILNILKCPVILKPIMLDDVTYDDTIVTYPSNQFIMTSSITGKEIRTDGTIEVSFMKDGIYTDPIDAGSYQIVINSHSSNLDINYQISYDYSMFTINPCPVKISLATSSKVYDGTIFDDYDKSFGLYTANKVFNAPYLYNDDQVYLTMYVTNELGYMVDPIDAGQYYLHVDLASINVENGLYSNYQFTYEEVIIEIEKRDISLKPTSGLTHIYNGEYYQYDKYSFEVFDEEAEKIDIYALISGLNAYIDVRFEYMYLDTEPTPDIEEYYEPVPEELNPCDAGVYKIFIVGHSSNLDNNFNVSYKEETLEIKPCEVEIDFYDYSKVYDGTPLEGHGGYYYINLSYPSTTFGSYLYNGEYINVLSTYFTDENGNRVSPVDAKTYYLHADLTNMEFFGYSGNYSFTYVPKEVTITPRPVDIIAYSYPNTIEYTGQAYEYNEYSYQVICDNGTEVISNNLIDNSKLRVSVKYYDDIVGGNEILPEHVKNVGTYYIEIDDYYFETGNANNFNILVWSRATLTITPADVEIRLYNDIVDYTGEVYVYDLGFEISRKFTNGASSRLINGDTISIPTEAYYFISEYMNTPVEPINAGKYSIYADLSQMIFTSGANNDSIIENYNFTLTTGQLVIRKLTIIVGVKEGVSKVYNGEVQQPDTTDVSVIGGNGAELFNGQIFCYGFLISDLPNEPHYINPINAGTYYAIITTIDQDSESRINFDVQISSEPVEFVITPREVVIAPYISAEAYYNGSIYEYNEYDFEVLLDNGELPSYEYKYQLIDGEELTVSVDYYDENGLETTPINAGTYYLFINNAKFEQVPGSKADINYIITYPTFDGDLSSGVILEIKPANVSIVPVHPGKMTYNGSVYEYPSQEFTASIYNGTNNMFYINELLNGTKISLNATITGDWEVCKNVGNYSIDDISVVFDDPSQESNYNISIVGLPITFEIVPVEVEIQILEDTKSYDGKAYDYNQGYSISVGEEGLAELYNNDRISGFDIQTRTLDGTIAPAINKGEYQMSVVTDSISLELGEEDSYAGNYTFISNFVSLEILQRFVIISVNGEYTHVYDGNYYEFPQYSYQLTDGSENTNSMTDEELMELARELGLVVDISYSNRLGTYENVSDVGIYTISTHMVHDSNGRVNSNFSFSNQGSSARLTISPREIVIKPVEQTHPYTSEVFNYPSSAYDVTSDTKLVDGHYAEIDVYFTKDGETITPIEVYPYYLINISSTKVYDANSNDVTHNYSIKRSAEETYLNIYEKYIGVELVHPIAITYGENYDCEVNIISGELLPNSNMTFSVYYTDVNGILCDKPTDVGTYYVYFDDFEVIGEHPKYSYIVQCYNDGLMFEITPRNAYIQPYITSNLVYDFDNPLTYKHSYRDLSENPNEGLLGKDLINFDVLIYDENGINIYDFTSAKTYTIRIDMDTLTGVENYNIIPVENSVTVKKLDIAIELENDSKIYDGEAFEFNERYKIYITKTNETITDVIDSRINVSFDNVAINVGDYKVSVDDYYFDNYDVQNFNVNLKSATYTIEKKAINVSFEYVLQEFTYDGLEIEFDNSVIVDPTTPLVEGESIYISSQFELINGVAHNFNIPVHSGSYLARYMGYDNYDKYGNYVSVQNYEITFINTAEVIINKKAITINALSQEYIFTGDSFAYPVLSDNSYEVISGSLVSGEQLYFEVGYYNELGEKVSPIYSGTYTIEIKADSIVTYADSIRTNFEDYDITIDESVKTLSVVNNTVLPSLSVEEWIYDGTNSYEINSTYSYYVQPSNRLTIELIYEYYDSLGNLLPDKPVDAGDYFVGIKDYKVYLRGSLDAEAYLSITLDTSVQKEFSIGVRNASIKVISMSKTYDGNGCEEEIEVILTNFISGQEVKYELSTPDGILSKCINAGTYRIEILEESVRMVDSELNKNYNIMLENGELTINPRPIYLDSTFEFNKIYDDVAISYTGSEWKYSEGSLELVGLDEIANVTLEFYGIRNSVYGEQTIITSEPIDAYEYTISIVDIEFIGGIKDNYEFIFNNPSKGVISPIAIGVQTGSYEGYYNGVNVELIDVFLLEGYNVLPGHYFGYIGGEPTIVSGVTPEEGIDNVVPYGVVKYVDGEAVDISGNYYTEVTNYGKIVVLPRPLLITTSTNEFVYSGVYHSSKDFVWDSDNILPDGITTLLPNDKINVTEATSVRYVTEGEVLNKLEVQIVDESLNDVTSCYDINYVYGTIKVIPYDVYITLSEQTARYTNIAVDPYQYVTLTDELGNKIADTLPAKNLATIYLSTTLDGIDSELINIGEYVVKVDRVIFTNSRGNTDLSMNYNVIYPNGSEFIFTIIKNKVTYTTSDVSSIWSGDDLYGELGYYYCEDMLNVYFAVDENTYLSAYKEDGTPRFTGSINNYQTIKIFDYNNNDVTENFDITYEYNGTISFVDEIIIHSYSSVEYDNQAHYFEVDNEGRYYVDTYDVYDEFGRYCSNVRVRLYIKDIYDSNENKVEEMIESGVYSFTIDEALTELYIKDLFVEFGITCNYGQLTYEISKRVIVVKPESKSYTYDGNEIKYEGFGITKFIHGSLVPGDDIYITTVIADKYTINSTRSIGISDIMIYRENEFGEMVPYTNWEDNYIPVYFYDTGSTKTSYIVNKNYVTHIEDPNTGEWVELTANHLKNKFKCSKISLDIWTSDYTKTYDGQVATFDSDDYYLVDESQLLPGHYFVLHYGYWQSTTTNSGSRTNSIAAKYWRIYDENGANVTQYYSLSSGYCGKYTINKREIVIGTKSASKVYDNTPLTYYGVDLTLPEYSDLVFIVSGSLVDGDKISLSETSFAQNASITYYGSVDNSLASFVIRSAQNKKVTTNYKITYQFGQLTITTT